MTVLVMSLCVACAQAGSAGVGPTTSRPGVTEPTSAGAATPAQPWPTATSRLSAYPSRLVLSPDASPAGTSATGRAVAAFAAVVPGTATLLAVLVLADGRQATLPIFTPENIVLSPDGRYLVRPTAGPGGQRGAALRDLTTGAEQQFDEPLYPIAWSPNSRWLLSKGFPADIVLVDAETGRVSRHFRPATTASAPVFFDLGAAVLDDGSEVQLPRATGANTYSLDVVDPATQAVRRQVAVRLPTTPRTSLVPFDSYKDLLPVVAGHGYLRVDVAGSPSGGLMPFSVGGRQAQPGKPIHLVVGGGPQLSALINWRAIGALPGLGPLFSAPAGHGAQIVAVDPASGQVHRLITLTEQQVGSVTLAALPG